MGPWAGLMGLGPGPPPGGSEGMSGEDPPSVGALPASPLPPLPPPLAPAVPPAPPPPVPAPPVEPPVAPPAPPAPPVALPPALPPVVPPLPALDSAGARGGAAAAGRAAAAPTTTAGAASALTSSRRRAAPGGSVPHPATARNSERATDDSVLRMAGSIFGRPVRRTAVIRLDQERRGIDQK